MNRLLVSLFLAAPLIPVSTTGMAQSQFDGRWSVTTIPEKGACRREHDYTVVVENGVARNAVSRRTTDNVTGGLEPDGRVRVSLQRRGAQVDDDRESRGAIGFRHMDPCGEDRLFGTLDRLQMGLIRRMVNANRRARPGRVPPQVGLAAGRCILPRGLDPPCRPQSRTGSASSFGSYLDAALSVARHPRFVDHRRSRPGAGQQSAYAPSRHPLNSNHHPLSGKHVFT